jgi:hypothetical protein
MGVKSSTVHSGFESRATHQRSAQLQQRTEDWFMTWTAALTWMLLIGACGMADLIRYSLRMGGR